METMRHRIARVAVGHRWVSLSIALVITAFFSYGLKDVHGKTIFSDLFPSTHPFVKTFHDHPNFGNPLTVTMMIERTDGKSVYNADTLAKMWWLSRDIDLVPGINHDQIVSIATEKARYVTLTSDGIYSNPILDEHLPKTDAELVEIKRRVNESPSTRTFLVSKDASSLILNATFIERLVDYGVVFDGVAALVTKYSDDHTKVFVAGFPTLTGWVYHFGAQTPEIFAVTLGLMFVFLTIVMRNLAGVLTPALVSAMSAIWGFGFVGWIREPVEPLLMVVPLLLIARSFSHSVQATARYYEVLAEVRDKRKAAELSLAVMIAPGTLGIFTDVCGLLMVGVAPIPAMQRFAIFTGFWAAMLVPTSVIMTQVFLSILPAPKNLGKLVGQNTSGVQQLLNRILRALATLSTGPRAKYRHGLRSLFARLAGDDAADPDRQPGRGQQPAAVRLGVQHGGPGNQRQIPWRHDPGGHLRGQGRQNCPQYRYVGDDDHAAALRRDSPASADRNTFLRRLRTRSEPDV